MAINVGIYPNYGDISYYSESEKEVVDKKIIRINSEEIEKVDLMFEEIKSEINGGELGSACICLDEYYYNEIRHKFIESGLKHGFKHVEIINYETAFYLNAMCQIKYKPKNGNIIWIKDGYKYNVWIIKNQKAQFIGYWESGTFYLNDFQKIVEKSQLNKGPNVLLYNSKINEATCKEFGCQLFCYKNDQFCFSKASLVKVEKTTADYEFAYLETESFLSHTVTLKIGENEIKTFQVGQILPISYSQKLIKEADENVLKVNEETVETPNNNPIYLIFNINTDEIYSVAFNEKSEKCG